MSSKYEKRLAALEKLLAEVEAHEQSLNGPAAPIRWGGGAPGMMDLFLSCPKRINQTEDVHLRVKYMGVMWLALSFFFHHLKQHPNMLQILDKGKLLELVGVAKRWDPKFKLLAEWYRANGFTDGKPDKAKLKRMKEMGCPVLV